jgi:hypothetical protein
MQTATSSFRPGTVSYPLESIGGAVPLDSRFYIHRPTDDVFRTAIAHKESIVLVKGARQMGKTSLLARGLQQARASGSRVILTDIQKLNAPQLESADQFFLTIADMMATQLDLDVLPQDVWKSHLSANQNFEVFLQQGVFESVRSHIVWGLDEVDRLFVCNYGSEIFGLFRSWHNQRALDPSSPWARFSLAISYATEGHLFIRDLNQSPFNVGTCITLHDFTPDQVAELNRRYGCPLRNDDEVHRFVQQFAGHPFLVRRSLHELAVHHRTVDWLEANADRDDGIFGDHLRRILVLLAEDPELREVVRTILRKESGASPASLNRLKFAGVMTGESDTGLRARCGLYHGFLVRHLL